MSTNFREQLIAYLQTTHWQELEREFWRTRRKQCCVCDATEHIRAQHICYRNLTDCTPQDLLPLCTPCWRWLQHMSRKQLLSRRELQAMTPDKRAPFLREQHRLHAIRVGQRSHPKPDTEFNKVVLNPHQQKPFKMLKPGEYRQS